ncbi:POK10 protein, partial [Sula dactylatra]|nr:POK10 protein [Sula dactylatra]
FLTEGNTRADLLTNVALHTPVPNTLPQAHLSHKFFHQAAKVLAKQFAISIGDAKLIVQTCPDCQQQPGPLYTVNPRGLFSLQIWQTDVMHIAEFGKQKYVHVSIDTYSHVVWATAL